MAADLGYPVIIVDSEWNRDVYGGRAIRAIADRLEQRGYTIYPATTADDGLSLISANPDLGCLLVAWNTEAERVIKSLRTKYERIPIFLMAEREVMQHIPANIVATVNEYIWKVEDTPDFIAGRVGYALRQYVRQLLPPFFGEVVRFAQHYEYSWHTPGHAGGTAFLKSAVGKEFFSFFGEQLFRSDLSVSVGELGSLLDHSGPAGAAEKHAARIFGADMTFFVTNGTSTSNRIVFQACVVDGDSVIVDRNCHKSIEQALTPTGGVPTYMMPTRNGYGTIGPIPPGDLHEETVQARISKLP
jgi:arginine decarboxylase